MAAAFAELRPHRHDTDYNMGQQFTRIEALSIVGAAERNSARADTFLVDFLTFEKTLF